VLARLTGQAGETGGPALCFARKRCWNVGTGLGRGDAAMPLASCPASILKRFRACFRRPLGSLKP